MLTMRLLSVCELSRCHLPFIIVVINPYNKCKMLLGFVIVNVLGREVDNAVRF